MTPAAVTIYQLRTLARALGAAGAAAALVTLLAPFTPAPYDALATPAAITLGLLAAALTYSMRADRMEEYADQKRDRL